MVRASKLIININLIFVIKYNFAKVFVDSKNSNVNGSRDNSQTEHSAVYQFKVNINNTNALNKLYTLYIGNKLIQVIRKNKNITLVTNKLKEVYTDF